MFIVMSHEATEEQIHAVYDRVRELGCMPHKILGSQRIAIGVTGNKGVLDEDGFSSMSGVVDVVRITKPYKLVGREVKPENTIVRIGDVEIGGKEIQIMAGPCAVESREQIYEVAESISVAGVKILRGGAFKPRTSPYSFQGLKIKGLELLKEAAEKYGMLVITEVKDTENLPAVAEHSDILQIGARNMQNFALLEAAAKYKNPILLKRGMAATIEEFLMAAEYIYSNGNQNVILCERGIRTFETHTRNTLDLNAVPAVKHLSHLPIVVDPSHGVGLWEYVNPMSKASIACGADGLIVEVHPHPEKALSDGPQSLKPKKFYRLLKELKPVAEAVGRTLNATVEELI
ncbi:phospho-2-dehydro-3-deoxyheptonate aldolase [Chloroherpeton thalassium ATCC 35110]|uniref:Phospho-2-dehydro-3-deoxyheptonate aldolase n=1 Tax=Chloroherpeton thalassium (strain ATCC 35110 / GB-78) TaxID=517418 RepID=B3QTY8_CHLT3|nr:3-deoxy-7-phosphoheptulonate synthase [Chloroherpeton thalassium]ACF12786.1 phospho-2-dehydro-3-deoxyheptonate aldolase [Chloroherpeton thalassium ATCC 35110]